MKPITLPSAAVALTLIAGAAGAQTVVAPPPATIGGQPVVTMPAPATGPAPTVLPPSQAQIDAAQAEAVQVRFICDSGGPFDATYNPGSGNAVLVADGASHTLATTESGFSDGTYRIAGAISLDGGAAAERVMIFRAGTLAGTNQPIEEIIGKNCLPGKPPTG